MCNTATIGILEMPASLTAQVMLARIAKNEFRRARRRRKHAERERRGPQRKPKPSIWEVFSAMMTITEQ